MSTPAGAQYTIGGSASTLTGGCYQLTAALNSQAGYVYQNQAIDLNQPFDLKFNVYLGTNNGGADGIMFVLRGTLAPPYIGSGGGAIGYDGPGFSSNSIGIEVDTWQNANFGDIVADHIGILKNGTVDHTGPNSLAGPIQASPVNANVEDGNYHIFNVRWDPATQELEVYLDCDYRLIHTGDIINNIFNGDNLVHWGFLGTTGGANNLQQFCLTEPIDSLVNDLPDYTICNGDSVQLDAGDVVMDYTWTPAAGLSSTTSNEPWASPSSTTTYEVEIVHNCDTVIDSTTVTVIQPSFTASGQINSALCSGDCDGAVDVSIANGSSTYQYNWNTGDTTQDISSLCAGSYTVTIQDVDTASSTYLCFLEESFTVNEPAQLTNVMLNTTKTSCPDGSTCDASAYADAQGGTFPYTFLWSSGEFTQQADQLCADSNFVTITDANNCTLESFVVIDIPDSIETTAYGDTMICIGNIASIIAASTGGTPPYSYVWYENQLNTQVFATTQTLGVTPSETTLYLVESTDNNGCTGDTAQVLVQVRPPLDGLILHEDTICPYDTIPLTVEGIGGDSIYTYSWDNGEFGDEIMVSPDLSQWYVVTISDLCGTPPFVDSTFVQVGGYSAITAAISVEDDSICAGESVYLIASGSGGFNGPDEYDYNWSFTPDKKAVQFVSPQNTRTYYLDIADRCLSSSGRDSVTVFVGKPTIPEVVADPFEVCASTDVDLVISNFQKDTRYRWWLDDTTFVENAGTDSILLRFESQGCNAIKIDATTAFGCFTERTDSCIVSVFKAPKAGYTAQPPVVRNIDQIITFADASEDAIETRWYIQQDTLVSPGVFQRYYLDTLDDLSFKVIAVSDEGCLDSVEATIPYIYITTLYYPKAFTPNGDGLNDVFHIKAEAISALNFDLRIYDRWGIQVFRSVNPSYGWDGYYPNGTLAPQGIYPFILQYRDHLGELHVIRDQVLCSSGKPIGIK